MTVSQFIDQCEGAFGSYRPGMRTAIEQRLRGTGWKELIELYDAVADEHTVKGAPPWAEIRRIASDRGVVLGGTSRVVYASVCEFCDTQYSVDSLTCPNCGKRRRVGKVVRAGGSDAAHRAERD